MSQAPQPHDSQLQSSKTHEAQLKSSKTPDAQLHQLGSQVTPAYPANPLPESADADAPRAGARRTGLVIGLMSGTSADGIDAALVRFTNPLLEPGEEHPLHVFPEMELVESHYVPYSLEQRKEIFRLFEPDVRARYVALMDARMGRWFGQAAFELMQKAGVAAADVCVISSHGQTVYHAPEQGVSLQIGDAAVIAQITGCQVVSDFRRGDVAAGGQGAPLVPYFDYAYFSSDVTTRVLLNIGGISNVTVLKPGGTLDDVLAFDTGPGNMLIDALVQKLTIGRSSYDRDGASAQAGKPDVALVETWLENDSYVQQRPPKSTGRERYGAEFLHTYLADMDHLSMADKVATMTFYVAKTIAHGITMVAQPPFELIIGGGGRHNRTLVRFLEELTKPSALLFPDAEGVPTDMKEAMAFALFGWQFIHGRPTNVPSATGARASVVLGEWTRGPRKE